MASAQRAPAADSEGSAASMSRDRTSGDFSAFPVIAATEKPKHDSLIMHGIAYGQLYIRLTAELQDPS